MVDAYSVVGYQYFLLSFPAFLSAANFCSPFFRQCPILFLLKYLATTSLHTRSMRTVLCLVQIVAPQQMSHLQQYVTRVMTSSAQNVSVKLPHANVVNTHCQNRNMELFVYRAHLYTGFLRINLMDTGALRVKNTVQKKRAEYVWSRTLSGHALYVSKNWMRATMLRSSARSMECVNNVTMIQILVVLCAGLVSNKLLLTFGYGCRVSVVVFSDHLMWKYILLQLSIVFQIASRSRQSRKIFQTWRNPEIFYSSIEANRPIKWRVPLLWALLGRAWSRRTDLMRL